MTRSGSLGTVHLMTEGDGDDLAVVDDTQRLTYSELDARINAVASALRRSCVVRGDRVVVRYGNSVDFVVAHLGVLRSGAVSVPIPGDASREQMSFMLQDTGASLLVQRDKDSSVTVEQRTIDELAEPASAGEVPFDSEPEDLASLMYTTGTSGRPKAVMLTHANTLAALRNIVSIVRPDRERELVTLPINHSFGLGQVYATLATRGTVYLAAGLLRLRAVIELIGREKITALPGTPSTFRLLLDRGGSRFVDAAQSLRLSVINSAPLPVATARELIGHFPRARFIVYYGLTEASRSTFLEVSSVADRQRSSVGTPAPGVDLSVVDSNGTKARPGQQGEIVISGPTVAKGYWQRSDETASAFRAGRLFTGDLGMMDEQGFVFILGRTKDIINAGGHKVAPGDVEAVISQHQSVADCAVLGLADSLAGEQVVAAVVMGSGEPFDPVSLMNLCAAQLQPHEIPRRFLAVAAIPRTVTGKILRDDLRRLIETPEC